MPLFKGDDDGNTLYGTNVADQMNGNGGDDSLKGFGGADQLNGGDGIDTAFYGDSTAGVAVNLATGLASGGSAAGDLLTSVENLFGSSHNDFFTGNDAANEFYGLDGHDVLVGGNGDDRLIAGAGNDILKGGGGRDHLEGGSGIDTVDYSAAPTGVWARLAGGPSYGEADGDTFVGIENVTGSEFGDLIVGNSGANLLRGLNGDDVLDGGEGDDRLEGGHGNDRLGGSEGADTMIGGVGDDEYRIDNVGDVVVETAGQGIDLVWSYISSYVLGANVENLRLSLGASDGTGNALDNDIGGTFGDNVLDGGIGVDTLVGYQGNDTYYVDNPFDVVREHGGEGSDAVRTSVSYALTPGSDVEYLATMSHSGTEAINLTGNANGNIVQGNDGANQIAGGDGRDELFGGGGTDRFLFDTAPNAASNMDVVTDFNVTDDTIVLENAVFTALAAGPLAADRFVVGTAALDGNDNVIYNAANGALLYDADGNGAGAAVQFAQAAAGLALTANDFLVV